MKKSLHNLAARLGFVRPRHSRARRKLLQACLALGLATAWCAPSSANVAVHIEVTPTETMTHAFLGYFTKNSSSVFMWPLGTLPGGLTSYFDHDFFGTPEEFDHSTPGGLLTPGYALIGLHGEGDNTGVSLSYPNGGSTVAGLTWDEIFFGDTEANVIHFLETDDDDEFGYLVRINGSELLTYYGEQATIMNFSTGTAGGTVLVTVPEPAAWILFASAAGGVMLVARRRIR